MEIDVFLIWQIDYWEFMGCEIRYEWMYQDYFKTKRDIDSLVAL